MQPHGLRGSRSPAVISPAAEAAARGARSIEASSAAPRQRPPSAEVVRYNAPVAESGRPHLRAVPRTQSFLHLFQFERIHAAAHRRAARREGGEVVAQDTRLKAAITPEGDLVAIAGATETRLRMQEPPPGESAAGTSPPAAETLLRELAYLSDARRLLVASGAALFGMSQRAMPRLRIAGSAASALRAMRNRTALWEETGREDLLTQIRRLSEREIGQLLDALAPVERSMTRLSSLLEMLAEDGGALTGLVAHGGAPALDAAVASPDAAPGSWRVRVDQVAQAHTVEASLYIPAETRLENVYGADHAPVFTEADYAFTLNGVAMSAARTDTLRDLARLINEGDPASDTGGTAAHGVVAEIRKGYLRLRAAEPGPTAIRMTDPDGLFAGMGMVERMDDESVRFLHEVTAPRSARLAVDDAVHTRASNEIADLIDGVTLTLRQPGGGEKTVSVESAFDALAGELQRLVESYNGAIRTLNEALSPSLAGLLRRQEKINRSYRNLQHAAEAPVAGQPEALSTPAQAGLSAENGTPVTFHEAQLDAALFALNATRPPPLRNAESPPSVFNALDAIGITARDDHTLRLDRDLLRRAVEEHPTALRDLFRADERGLLPRLRSTVTDIVDPARGLLAWTRRRLESLGGDIDRQTLTQVLQRSREAAFREQLVRASTLSILA